MSDAPLLGVVIGHGTVAPALVAAAEEITGVRGALVPISNARCDRASLLEEVTRAVGDRAAVLFVDMPSGSCFHASLVGLRTGLPARVVTGVNLAMLIDFLFHREATVAEAAARAADVGARAVAAPPPPATPPAPSPCQSS